MAKKPTTPVGFEDLDYVPQDKAEELRKRITERWGWGREYWKPAHDRMDFWANMYWLLDLVQQSKPLGFRRYVSNDPQTAIDAAIAILTRNESFWRIDITDDMDAEERRRVETIERALSGIVDDLDELYLMRGEPRLWTRVAQHALLRGWIVGKFHVTEAAIDLGRPSPLLSEMWDMRLSYPAFDGIGLNYIVVEKPTNLAEIVSQFPEMVKVDLRNSNPLQPMTKLEYWSNDRGDEKGVTAVLAVSSPTQPSFGVGGATSTDFWLIPPYYHGYRPDQLPVVVMPVNGVDLQVKPQLSQLISNTLADRADLLSMMYPSWHGAGGLVAERGRSILVHVEEQVPQYNELIATIFQHFSIGTYPAWVFNTSSGELPPAAMGPMGMNAKIPLRLEERADLVQYPSISTDAFRLIELLQDERQKGILSNILQAVSPIAGSGVLFQQVANAALNALQPFSDGMTYFGVQMGSHILAQMQEAELEPFQVVGRSSHSYFRIDFDPAETLGERKYKPKPVFKPALPDDLIIRAEAARILLDPRRPVMSLFTVLDKIFQLDDPEGEIDRIFEDIALLDPIIVLERVIASLRRLGEDEIASRVEQQEFRAKFIEDFRFRQMQASAGVEGALPSPRAEAGGAVATGAGGGRPGVGVATERPAMPSGERTYA